MRASKRATSCIGYREGSTLTIGGRCGQSAPGFARSGFANVSGAFRVIYVATFADAVYVLHAFPKKTRQTAKQDIELATSRLREQMARRR